MADTRSVSSDDDLEIIDFDEEVDEKEEVVQDQNQCVAEVLNELIEKIIPERESPAYLEELSHQIPKAVDIEEFLKELRRDQKMLRNRQYGIEEDSEEEDELEDPVVEEKPTTRQIARHVTEEELAATRKDNKTLDAIEMRARCFVLAVFGFAMVMSAINTVRYFNEISVVDNVVSKDSDPSPKSEYQKLVDEQFREYSKLDFFNSLLDDHKNPICQLVHLKDVSRHSNFEKFTFTVGYTVPLVIPHNVFHPNPISGKLEVLNYQDYGMNPVRSVEVDGREPLIYLLENEANFTLYRKQWRTEPLYHEVSIRFHYAVDDYIYDVRCEIPDHIIGQANFTTIDTSTWILHSAFSLDCSQDTGFICQHLYLFETLMMLFPKKLSCDLHWVFLLDVCLMGAMYYFTSIYRAMEDQEEELECDQEQTEPVPIPGMEKRAHEDKHLEELLIINNLEI